MVIFPVVRTCSIAVSCSRNVIGVTSGIDALREVIIDKDAPASAKVSAAKAAIELSGVGAPKEITQSGKQEIVVRYLESKDK